MSQAQQQDINFWPAYVDALINVVLNLLFLAGVFTIGLVVLNIEALNAEKQAAALKVKELLAGASPHQRPQKALALLKTMPPAHPPMPTEEAEASASPSIEIRISRPNVTNKTTPDANVLLEPSPELVKATALAQNTTGGRVLVRVVFGLGQYTPPEGWSHSLSTALSPAQRYALLAITDPNNSRLTREAFARLMSLRHALGQMGIAEKQIDVVIAPANEDIHASNDIERSVFVIELTK